MAEVYLDHGNTTEAFEVWQLIRARVVASQMPGFSPDTSTSGNDILTQLRTMLTGEEAIVQWFNYRDSVALFLVRLGEDASLHVQWMHSDATYASVADRIQSWWRMVEARPVDDLLVDAGGLEEWSSVSQRQLAVDLCLPKLFAELQESRTTQLILLPHLALNMYPLDALPIQLDSVSSPVRLSDEFIVMYSLSCSTWLRRHTQSAPLHAGVPEHMLAVAATSDVQWNEVANKCIEPIWGSLQP